jgi:hypothetical protein
MRRMKLVEMVGWLVGFGLVPSLGPRWGSAQVGGTTPPRSPCPERRRPRAGG